jgi:hypothetical protein
MQLSTFSLMVVSREKRNGRTCPRSGNRFLEVTLTVWVSPPRRTEWKASPIETERIILRGTGGKAVPQDD